MLGTPVAVMPGLSVLLGVCPCPCFVCARRLGAWRAMATRLAAAFLRVAAFRLAVRRAGALRRAASAGREVVFWATARFVPGRDAAATVVGRDAAATVVGRAAGRDAVARGAGARFLAFGVAAVRALGGRRRVLRCLGAGRRRCTLRCLGAGRRRCAALWCVLPWCPCAACFLLS